MDFKLWVQAKSEHIETKIILDFASVEEAVAMWAPATAQKFKRTLKNDLDEEHM